MHIIYTHARTSHLHTRSMYTYIFACVTRMMLYFIGAAMNYYNALAVHVIFIRTIWTRACIHINLSVLYIYSLGYCVCMCLLFRVLLSYINNAGFPSEASFATLRVHRPN